MVWFWVGLSLMVSLPLGVAAYLSWLYFVLRRNYLHLMVRIFQEKPSSSFHAGSRCPARRTSTSPRRTA